MTFKGNFTNVIKITKRGMREEGSDKNTDEPVKPVPHHSEMHGREETSANGCTTGHLVVKISEIWAGGRGGGTDGDS